MNRGELIMNYHNILHDDMKNGEGLRVVLFVSGCMHKCKNCHNPETWNIESGIPFDEDAKNEIFDQLSKDYIHGITFSGGDPLHKDNMPTVEALIDEIRIKFPTKTIWLYTGYEYEAIQNLSITHKIDVLVDGRFVEELKDPKLEYRGSSNQRILKLR